MATGKKNQQTGQAGEHFVAAELNRRGAFAVTFAGNMPGIDILASNEKRSRIVQIQVKTRRAGTWHTSSTVGKKCKVKRDETSFWIFVDLSKIDNPPEYYIVPENWIKNNIYEEDKAYWEKRGGSRDSKHHGVPVKRIEQWKDCWDILKLF